MLLGYDEDMNRCLPSDVLKGQHLLLFVYHLRVNLPAHYLAEHAIVLAHRPLPPVFVRPTTALPRATAAIPAVSLRNLYGPSDARERPPARAASTSLSLNPPSGPTSRQTTPRVTVSSKSGQPASLCRSRSE